MSDIPEDIERTAAEAASRIMNKAPLILTIARALLAERKAERERCAVKACFAKEEHIKNMATELGWMRVFNADD